MRQQIEVSNLAAHLERVYPFGAVSLSPMPRGLVSRTFRLDSDEGAYFVKCAHIGEISQRIERSLPVLNALGTNGLQHIPTVIPTQNGDLFTVFDYYLCTVYSYIAGSGGLDYDFDRYLSLLTTLHQTTVAVDVYSETFEIPFARVFQEDLRRLLRQQKDDDESAAIRDLILRRYDALLYHWKRFQTVAAQCQHPDAPCEQVITHGDAPNSVRINEYGQLYIVDWDDIRLAPPERDTWFHLFSGERQRFLSLYDPMFPDYRPNEQAIQFFVYYRFFDELVLYIGRHMGTENRALQQAYRQKLHRLFHWLEPIINQFR